MFFTSNHMPYDLSLNMLEMCVMGKRKQPVKSFLKQPDTKKWKEEIFLRGYNYTHDHICVIY